MYLGLNAQPYNSDLVVGHFCYTNDEFLERVHMFEYKVISAKDKLFGNRFDPAKLESTINALGAEGWELIEIANSDTAGMLTNRSEMIMIFKRKK